jgi:hypothetical protein
MEEEEEEEDSFTEFSSTAGPLPFLCAATRPQFPPPAAAEISLFPLLSPPLPEVALVAAGLHAPENDLVRSGAATVASSEGLMHKRSTKFENRQSKVNQTRFRSCSCGV